MDINIQNKIKQLKRLKQYKNKTDLELIEIAQKSLNEQKEKELHDFVLEGLVISKPEDKQILENILSQYLNGVYIENKRQLFHLKDLVYNEYKKRTIREQIGAQEKDKPNSVPKHAYEALQGLIEQGQKLAERIFGVGNKDDVSNLKQFFSRIKLWLGENQGSRTAPCPHCGKMFVAKIQMSKYDVGKHPFFKDKLLTNNFLMEKYLEGKPIIIDEKVIAKILDCSELYTDWFLNRHFSKSNPLYAKYIEKMNKNKD